MPPHNGHRYLIDFAAGCVDRLSVLVCTLSHEPIDGELRFGWVRKMFPEANVVHITEENPSARKGSPDSYKIWARGITDSVGADIDFVFASEDYGHRLAGELGAVYVPVDPARSVFPVSATMIRRNPMGSWRFVPAIVRPYFVRRVYVLSEGAGESDSLLEHFADHYRTVSVGDYVAYHAGRLGEGAISPEFAVRAQIAAEDALALQANRVLFSASDRVHAWIRAKNAGGAGSAGECGGPGPEGSGDSRGVRGAPGADLRKAPPPARPRNDWTRRRYLINLPSGARDHDVDDKERLPILSEGLRHLSERGEDVRLLTGDWPERIARATEAVDDLLAD